MLRTPMIRDMIHKFTKFISQCANTAGKKNLVFLTRCILVNCDLVWTELLIFMTDVSVVTHTDRRKSHKP